MVLYLDGRKDGPVCHGKSSPETLLEVKHVMQDLVCCFYCFFNTKKEYSVYIATFCKAIYLI